MSKVVSRFAWDDNFLSILHGGVLFPFVVHRLVPGESRDCFKRRFGRRNKCQASVAKSKWQKFYWREIDSDESKPLQPFRNHFMGGFWNFLSFFKLINYELWSCTNTNAQATPLRLWHHESKFVGTQHFIRSVYRWNYSPSLCLQRWR